MGKIIHGNANFGYAPINVSGTTYSFGTPVMIKGLVSATIEVEQNETKIYADNEVYNSVKGAKARTAKASFRFIPSSYAEYLGFVANTNGMLTDSGTFEPHCIFFETTEENDDGTSTRTLHYLYNVTAKEPTTESKTDEEEVEAREIEVNYTCNTSDFVVDTNGEACQYGYITRTSTNANLYDTFRTAVIKPTDVIPQSI